MSRDRRGGIVILSWSFSASTIARVISSWRAKIPCISRSYVSDQQREAFAAFGQLGRHSNPVSLPANGPFKNVIDVQLVSDFGQLGVLAFKPERRTPGRDPQAADFRQRGDDFLGDAVTEIIVIMLRD